MADNPLAPTIAPTSTNTTGFTGGLPSSAPTTQTVNIGGITSTIPTTGTTSPFAFNSTAPASTSTPTSTPATQTTQTSTSNTPTIPGYTLTASNAPGAQQVTAANGQIYYATKNASPITAGSGSTTPPAANASGAGGISSSSSLVTSANGNASVNAATGGDTSAQQTAVTNIASTYSALYGTSVNSSDISAIMTANPNMTIGQAAQEAATIAQGRDEKAAAAAQEAKTEAAATTLANQQTAGQAAMYSSDLAANNAQYASASAQLNDSQNKAVSTMTAQLASLGVPISQNSAAQGALNRVNTQFQMAQAQLNSQATQAQAALDQANYSAYNTIQTNMQNTIATAQANMQNTINDVTTQQTAAGVTANTEMQNSQTLAANTQSKAAAQYNTGLSTLTSSSPISSLFNADGTPVAGVLTNSAFTNSSIYQQGIAAGYSPSAILGDAQNAVKTSKAADAQSTLQTNLLKAQIEEANSATAANSKILNDSVTAAIASTNGTTAKDGTTINGDAYNNGIASIAENGQLSVAKQNSLQGFVQSALAVGDTTQAKNLMKTAAVSTMSTTDKNTYNALTTINAMSSDLASKIAGLPTNILNGNINDLKQYWGANSDAMTEYQSLVDHQSMLYSSLLSGKRFTSDQVARVQNLFPSTDNTPNVNLDKIKALNETTQTVQTSALQNAMGPDNYNQIFSPSSSSSTVTMTGPGGTFSVPAANVSVFTQNGYTQQ